MNKNDGFAAFLARELSRFVGTDPKKLKKFNTYLVNESAAFYLKENDNIIG